MQATEEEDMKEELTTKSKLRQSFIQPESSNIVVRCLKKFDIFAFIPVPKDQAVSTRQSLVGTALFFVLFLSYIIYDFVVFAIQNPPIKESFHSPLDAKINYPLPRFALAFMKGESLNETDQMTTYLQYSLSQEVKSVGNQTSIVKAFTVLNLHNSSSNFEKVDWINSKTKQFYQILRTSSSDAQAQGLLYVTDTSTSTRVKIQRCNININPLCVNNDTMDELLAGGRLFIFIENILDNTTISKEDQYQSNGNNYLLYNFFLQRGVYKRITVNFVVMKTEIYADYLWRWKRQYNTRLAVESITEQISDVSYFAKKASADPLDLISVTFQLSPQVLETRVTFSTLLDHISLWGAFWGVLFGLFAIIFLTYNRKKFYKKNPDWDRFKQKDAPETLVIIENKDF